MEKGQRYPDNAWFDGKIASWEGRRFGYRELFEVIVSPATFKETVNSAGDDEIVELFEPSPSDRLKLTYLDENDIPTSDEPIVLNESNPTVIIPKGTRYIMDATDSNSVHLAYTCICFGEQALIE